MSCKWYEDEICTRDGLVCFYKENSEKCDYYEFINEKKKVIIEDTVEEISKIKNIKKVKIEK
jgi:hypothetical protein